MYLNEKLIKGLKIKNILFIIIAIFNIIVSSSTILHLFIVYIDDMETFRTAKAMPDSILFMEIGICLLIEALISGKCIADGYPEFDDIAQVIVKRPFFVKLQLLIFSCIYMKNYDIKTVDGKEKVVLRSKTVTCQCQSCGATLEKKIYFTGECPYCGSSDNRCSQRPVPVQLLRKYDNGRHRQKDLNNNKRQSTAFGLYFFGDANN